MTGWISPRLANPEGLLATWFGAGLLPWAPGTWGSLAALPCAWVLVWVAGWPLLLVATILVFAVGIWSSERYSSRSKRSDPGEVVIDEVAGQWLVLCLMPLDVLSYLAGFVAFRFFDITKPWPVSWAERRLRGGLGIMADDIVAALYGLIVLFPLQYYEILP
jgi:phosphatidylglycerophosphatase A